MTSDEHFAERVRQAVTHLNQALGDAWEAGLRVELDHMERSDLARRDTLRMYSAKVFREV